MDFLAKRQIRVFISSTFEDMKDEREYLIKKIFPEMRQVAYKRNVSFIESWRFVRKRKTYVRGFGRKKEDVK